MSNLTLFKKYICSDVVNIILSYLESSDVYNFCCCNKSCETYLKIFFRKLNYHFTDLNDISFEKRKYITKIHIDDNWKYIRKNRLSQFEDIIIDNEQIDIRKFSGTITSLKYLKFYKTTQLLYPNNLEKLINLDIRKETKMTHYLDPNKFKNLKSLTISNGSYILNNLKELKKLTTLNLLLRSKHTNSIPPNITNLKISYVESEYTRDIVDKYKNIVLPQNLKKLIIDPEITISFSKNKINFSYFPSTLKYISLPPDYVDTLDIPLELNYLKCNFKIIEKKDLSKIKYLDLHFDKFNNSIFNNLIKRGILNKIVGIRFLVRIKYSTILNLKDEVPNLKVLYIGSTITHLHDFSPKNIGDYFPKNTEEIYISNSKVYCYTPIIINMNKYKKLKKIVYC